MWEICRLYDWQRHWSRQITSHLYPYLAKPNWFAYHRKCCVSRFAYCVSRTPSVMMQAHTCTPQMQFLEHQWLPLTAHRLQKTATWGCLPPPSQCRMSAQVSHSTAKWPYLRGAHCPLEVRVAPQGPTPGKHLATLASVRREEVTLHNDLLLHGRCIVVPLSLQKETLNKIHSGHQGIHRCQSQASTSMWWPGIKQQVEQPVQHCPKYTKALVVPWQPMLPTPLPGYPWQWVTSYLYKLNQKTYLLVADYFSRYVWHCINTTQV